MSEFIKDPLALCEQICRALSRLNFSRNRYRREIIYSPRTSSVLFLLGMSPQTASFSSEPCLILNKRSANVKQPGDLCFPGGHMASQLDPHIAKLLYLPGSPLKKWPQWPGWRYKRRQQAETLSVLLANALREGFEEMRLNPLRLKFLGPLPAQQLTNHNRTVYPLVCWVGGRKRFRLNREVEKIVYLPLKNLLAPEKYACCRFYLNPGPNDADKVFYKSSHCYIYETEDESERLWGATFRMVMEFLGLVFDFTLPELDSLPMVEGYLDRNYLNRMNKKNNRRERTGVR